ncbi:MAG: M23 family metallopeptidase [Nitrospirae bacterium]|nr:M23 family metallopeptidase [Nitrospirota bacterium]
MIAFKRFMRRLFSPITVMVIPHNDEKTYRFKLPSVGAVLVIALWFSLTGYVISVGVTTQKYNEIKDKAEYYQEQFKDLHTTVNSLKKAEAQFKKLFSVKNKEEVFKDLDTTDSGSIDIEMLRRQIEKSVETAGAIKDYIRQQKDMYYATPQGPPVSGSYISSDFGYRTHPRTGRKEFHSGLDLPASPGTPVKVTADGIVSFAGLSGGSGKLVVIEHGFGYTTCYAHNKEIAVAVGQKVKRGTVISYVGSTGDSTGPHLHYEVWKDSVPKDPTKFLDKNV